MRSWRVILLGLFLPLALLSRLGHAGEGQGLLLSGTAYYSQDFADDHSELFDSHDEGASFPVRGVHEVTFKIYKAGSESESGNCSGSLAGTTGTDAYDGVDYVDDAELVHTIVQDVEFSEGTVEIKYIKNKRYEYLVGAGRFAASLGLDGEFFLTYANIGRGDNRYDGVSDTELGNTMSSLCVGMTIGGDEELLPRVQYNPVPFARISEYAIALKTNPGQPQIIESQLSLDKTPSSEEVADASLLIMSDYYVEDSTTESPYLMALQSLVPHANPTKDPITTDVLTVRADGHTSLYGDLILEGDDRVFNLGGGSLVVDEATLNSTELSYLNGVTSNLQTQIDSLVAGTGPLGISIESSEITDDTIASADIAADTIAAVDIAASAVGTSEIADDVVTTSDLAATLTFAAGDIVNLSAATSDGKGLKLPQGTTDSPTNSGNVEGLIYWDTDNDALKVFDGSTWASITGGGSNPFGSAIDSNEITDATITTTDIATDTIVAGNIANNAVSGAEISDGSVASADIAADTITAADMADGSVGAAEMSDTLCLDIHSVEINPTETGNNIDYINLVGDNTFSTIEENEDQFMVPINVMANSLIATTNVAPTSGSWIVTLRVNSMDTALTCTISAGATSCGAAGITAMVAAGSKLDIKVTTSMSSPAATSALNVAFCFGQ